jgi:hypothetical protein
MSRPRQPWSGYACQVLAAVVLALAWGRLCEGLLLPPSDDPMVDLEAGGGFAASVLVYLPGLVLTAVLAGLVLVALSPRPASAPVLIAAAGVVVAFTAYVLIQDALLAHYLTDYLPGLGAHVWQAMALAEVSIVPAAASTVVRSRQIEDLRRYGAPAASHLLAAPPAR